MPLTSPQIEDIFSEALAKASACARAAYLDLACSGNVELRQRVDALLAAHDATNNLLELPAGDEDEPTVLFSPLAEGPGAKIGRYKLLEQIGEGGFGVVFMAEQQEPVRRRVALKIIKLGMDTKQVVARFEAERQALALMDHPNIAKVLDAGATDTGRPYFVMELVRGVSITHYCDEHKLSTANRLKLFIEVCSAVQHAHQKGVIHRDLKPSNILVMMNDDRPVPKIIDFGIAKATQARLTERTLFTEFRQMIGTPAYMSPEQALMSGVDIDTRSDIYSLGVLLYELLTGTTPFVSRELLRHGYAEMQRMIREVEPPPPSTRFYSLSHPEKAGATAHSDFSTIAANRGVDPHKLVSLLRGDLDWIVMRCLEKDRARRYETANGLARDIQHYLADEPVEARRPTRAYRLKKFVRRNKTAVVATSAIAAALVAGLILASVGFVRARNEAARSEQVSKFLTDVLASAGPSVARGRDASLLREMLDQNAERMSRDLAGQPEIQGDIWYTLGTTYIDIGENRRATDSFQQAVNCYRSGTEKRSSKLAIALARLGSMQTYMGDAADGTATARQGLEMAHELGNLDAIATCLVNVSFSFGQIGGYTSYNSEGVPYLREALAIRKRLNDNPVALADCMGNLASELHGANNEAESLALARQSLALYRQQLNPEHPKCAQALLLLAQILLDSGNTQESVSTFREAVELYRKTFPPKHPKQVRSLALFVQALIAAGKLEEAQTAIVQAAEFDPTNSQYWAVLGNFHAGQSNWLEAIPAFERAVDLQPTSNAIVFRMVLVYLMAGEQQEYRSICHRYLTFALTSREFHSADMGSKVALLLPVEGDDFERACQLSQIAADTLAETEVRERKPLASWSHLDRALTNYRCGRFDDAIEQSKLTVASERPSNECCATAWFITAASRAKLQDAAGARAALADGEKVFLERQDLDSWPDIAIAQYLRREASELIERLPTAKD